MPDVDLMTEDEELEGQEEGQEGSESRQVELPHNAQGVSQTRESLIEEAMNEGVEEGVLEELGSKQGELTIEDLRRLPGAEGYTDEQLMAEWKKASANAGSGNQPDGGTGNQPETFKLPFPIYDDKGNKIDALDKVDLKALLEGKLQIGYTALGKEQRKTLSEALRNASLGHFNAQRYDTAVSERNQAAQQLREIQAQVEQFQGMQKSWDAALSALAMGNIKPMQDLAQRYIAALQNNPVATPGMIPVEVAQREQQTIQRGMEFAQTHIEPKLHELAQQYGANVNELREAVKHYITREGQFFTLDKLNQILEYEVPALLDAHGYKPVGQPAGQAPAAQAGNTDEIKALQETVAALQAKVAGNANQAKAGVRAKVKGAPVAGSGSVPGAGEAMPSFSSRSQMQAWLRGDPEWKKA